MRKKDLDIFVQKAAMIIAEAPYNARKEDKIALLNRKFRLNRKDSEILLKVLKC